MRQSQLFTTIRKEAPKDETSKNAKFLIRGGFIHKELAGAYAYLPLGLRVLTNICNVIREEMNAVGGQEMIMTALQDKTVWEHSGRWDDAVIDVWFKTRLSHGAELGLANTHEEAVTHLMKEYIHSYKDLPVAPYQFQTKFRNEKRAKSGILRGREFLMKDLYSFSYNDEEHEVFYEKVKEAYHRIFNRLGIGTYTYLTSASGGSFSPYSHEFQTVCEAGEDVVFLDTNKGVAINKEIYTDDVVADLGLDVKNIEKVKAIEVGNIFSLGTKFSEALGLTVLDENNASHPVVMGSYGIGPGRVMGTMVELFATDTSIVWPRSIAPFSVHIIQLGSDEKTHEQAERLYKIFIDSGIRVLLDDRDTTAGEKFSESDFIGAPVRIIVSERARESGGVEVTNKESDETKIMDEETMTAPEGIQALVSE